MFATVQIDSPKPILNVTEWLDSPQWVKERIPCPAMKNDQLKITAIQERAIIMATSPPSIRERLNIILEPRSPLHVQASPFIIEPSLISLQPTLKNNHQTLKNNHQTVSSASTSKAVHVTSPVIYAATSTSPSCSMYQMYSSPTSKNVNKSNFGNENENSGTQDIVPSPRVYVFNRDIVPFKSPSKPIRGPGVPWQVTNTNSSRKPHTHLFSTSCSPNVMNLIKINDGSIDLLQNYYDKTSQ